MGCPTPNKKLFRSKAEAKRYNREFRSYEKARLWPYLCPAPGVEHWHLSNQNYDEQKRIAEAIRQGTWRAPIDTADNDR